LADGRFQEQKQSVLSPPQSHSDVLQPQLPDAGQVVSAQQKRSPLALKEPEQPYLIEEPSPGLAMQKQPAVSTPRNAMSL
jgi:hypothetical protein